MGTHSMQKLNKVVMYAMSNVLQCTVTGIEVLIKQSQSYCKKLQNITVRIYGVWHHFLKLFCRCLHVFHFSQLQCL